MYWAKLKDQYSKLKRKPLGFLKTLMVYGIRSASLDPGPWGAWLRLRSILPLQFLLREALCNAVCDKLNRFGPRLCWSDLLMMWYPHGKICQNQSSEMRIGYYCKIVLRESLKFLHILQERDYLPCPGLLSRMLVQWAAMEEKMETMSPPEQRADMLAGH